MLNCADVSAWGFQEGVFVFLGRFPSPSKFNANTYKSIKRIILDQAAPGALKIKLREGISK
jgi:hypothetical protein